QALRVVRRAGVSLFAACPARRRLVRAELDRRAAAVVRRHEDAQVMDESGSATKLVARSDTPRVRTSESSPSEKSIFLWSCEKLVAIDCSPAATPGKTMPRW